MSIPVFVAERTGKFHALQKFECECGHAWELKVDNRDWPEASKPCKTCGKPVECKSISTFTEMRRADTGQLFARPSDLPAGAVYADWDKHGDDDRPHNWRKARDAQGRIYVVNRPGPDGRVLVCVLPDGHHWVIDSRCNNCGSPDDDEHWCWVRHGAPEDGTLHVDKVGLTCSAGGGSIATSGWHGFLHHGALVQC